MFLVMINGDTALAYQPHARLPGHVRRLLDEMDADMDHDLELDGERIESPDTLQRGRFVAMKLIQAIQAGNEGLKAATCAWLSSRLPDLRRIQAEDTGDTIYMALILE
jgi:hypothetical protein